MKDLSDSWCTEFFKFLILDIKPAFIQPPEDTTVTEGMTAVLTCEVSGAPKPAISWKKGSQLLELLWKSWNPHFLVHPYYWDSVDPFSAYFFIFLVLWAVGLLWGCCEPVAWIGRNSLLEELELQRLIRAVYVTLITLFFPSVFQENRS